MLKRILTILLITGLTFSQFFAQESKSGSFARLKSMGNNPFVSDPTDMMVNPAWGNYYNNILFGDLGETIANNFESGGIGQFLTVNFDVAKNFTVGATLARKSFQSSLSIANLDPYNIVGETNNALGTSGLVEMDNNWVIMSSYNFSGHILGFGISYASTISETKPANGGGIRADANQLGINIGYLGKLSPILKLDLSAVLLFPGTTYETPQSSETKFSQSVISIIGRGFYKADSRFTIVPCGKIVKTSGTADLGDANGITTTDLPSMLSFQFGVGVLYKFENFLFAGGPSFGILEEKTPSVSGVSPELTRTTNSFPIWNFGAEWNMIEWLIGRIGYRSKTNTVSNETVASPTNSNETIFTSFDPAIGGITLGIGFKFSGFSLDATINEDVIRQGFNNLGGGGATFAYVSAGYEF
ncbi:MAG: hypothetical protein H6610_00675 [Ignavibacteriales bacterium]|nr:hypothetical protein [Ignavibacteriales bacterium]MCB9217953.1 hypothetical protein [Ignavibacteriales bacterium]